jgi:phosphoribosylformimino-5-aminoimidazole carboxamide ribotide isomerase
MNSPRPFRLLPAIDLIDGRAVRLVEGDFDRLITSPDDDARTRARDIWAAGATALHVIDLDAARRGSPGPPNADVIADIARSRPEGALLQLGGGLRTIDAVEAALAGGADRVLLGTMALRDSAALASLVESHGERIGVALDCREGTVRVSGWTEDAGVPVARAAAALAERGVRTLLVTGIERDGSLAGPDLELLAEVVGAVGSAAGVIAAGGVTTPDDVRAVRDLGCVGAVAGRVLLERPSALAELLAAAE